MKGGSDFLTATATYYVVLVLVNDVAGIVFAQTLLLVVSDLSSHSPFK
jgi:hypothetical protein